MIIGAAVTAAIMCPLLLADIVSIVKCLVEKKYLAARGEVLSGEFTA